MGHVDGERQRVLVKAAVDGAGEFAVDIDLGVVVEGADEEVAAERAIDGGAVES